ncbi:glycosyltransferase [Vibrio europaeus]|uniref:Glycosyltransferase n=1 Tax=Vibrio europaeus TaxID=300876 RepID=A0A178J7U1_9VIBR|nr:glycosyltransferase family 2 protein [Vibrio europaeus]MDC5705015.1 glycosyltransferase family 2 protein [Vibrio europaeus]MDC5710294.1 glycosyltransferase [Vibrio europaeus]MDC5715384.1 glycosyltransferase [Vibrio europaeus]MDC5724567.1 glycosyltransferase [Vibrio europaeus]MDC5728736.1 glycosyltransferase [Vibrio europaeus]
MVKLSIIIPTYGRVNKINSAIESALVNDCIEVIVVDDNGKGSENQIRTQKIVGQFENNERVIYHPLEKNSGAGIARNVGISKAKGDYITFLDDDDLFIDELVIEKLRYFEEKSAENDICCSHMRTEREGKRIASGEDKFIGSDAKTFLMSGSCFTSMIMIKKSSIVQIGGFYDTPYLQDHTLMLKAFINGLKVCVFEQETFIHNLHDGATITTGKRPVSGVALRCKLEKELSRTLELADVELKCLAHRWNTIQSHQEWLTNGRSLKLAKYLLLDVFPNSSSLSQLHDSIKLLIKFVTNYQYYSR